MNLMFQASNESIVRCPLLRRLGNWKLGTCGIGTGTAHITSRCFALDRVGKPFCARPSSGPGLWSCGSLVPSIPISVGQVASALECLKVRWLVRQVTGSMKK